jgi:hypothetical protein
MVVAICLAVVAAPVGVWAATGSYVNIRDFSNTGSTGYSRVINNRIVTEQCDSAVATIGSSACARIVAGKSLVGDGSGALTVDGSVQESPSTPYVGRPQGSSDSYYPAGSVSVPAGKRWVIESISIAVQVPSGQPLLEAYVTRVTAGVPSYVYVPMSAQGTYSGNGLTYYTGALAYRLYADPGTSVGVTAFRGTPTGTAYIQGELSGYLV